MYRFTSYSEVTTVRLVLFQMQLSPTRDSTPLSRDYMVDTERRYLEDDRF